MGDTVRGLWASRIQGLFLSAIVVFSQGAAASPGLDWLSTQQQPDGGVYTAADLATPNQSSLEALVTRQFLGEPGEIDPSLVVDYLASAPASDTEHLAAKIMAGILTEGEASIPALLADRQNADGGFGSQPGYQSTPYDTFWALQALEISGQLGSNERFYAVQYLLNTQNPNGAWGYIVTDSEYLTARIQQLLVGYQSQFGNAAEAVESASVFLNSADTLAAPLTRDYFAACLALSSLSAANNTQDLASLNDAILDGQGTDGSWQQDVFSTALCLRALVQYEAGQQGTTLSSIAGQVVESGSNRPIAGVSVSMSGVANGSTTTDNDGRFVLSGLSVSAANLEFTAAGYLTTVRGLSLSAGANNLGVVPMAQSTLASLVRGTVVDATTAGPVSAATVVLAGAESYSVTTDAFGDFSLPNVEDGAYTLTVTRSGFYDGSMSVNVTAGNSYDLRLQLASTDTVLDDTPAPISGRIVDGSSGLPIIATIRLDDGSPLAVGSDGLFVFDNVDRGDLQLHVSAGGYIAATYNINFPAGAQGSVGDLALYPASDNNAATDINLTITVVDAVTGTPIAGASITETTTSSLLKNST